MQGLQSIAEELKDRNVAVVGISADPVEAIKKHTVPKGFTFPLLADPELKAIDAFGLRHPGGYPTGKKDIARPALILIDDQGKVLFRWLTENWRVRPTPEMILSKLNEIDS